MVYGIPAASFLATSSGDKSRHLRLYIGAIPEFTWRSCSASSSSGVQKHLYANPRSSNSLVYLR